VRKAERHAFLRWPRYWFASWEETGSAKGKGERVDRINWIVEVHRLEESQASFLDLFGARKGEICEREEERRVLLCSRGREKIAALERMTKVALNTYISLGPRGVRREVRKAKRGGEKTVLVKQTGKGGS